MSLIPMLLLLLLFGLRLSAAEYELWILAGQSNAQGWKGDACHYPRGDPEIDRRIPFYHAAPGIGWCGGRWLGLSPQPGLFKRGHFGPEITFARELAAAGRQVAIFKFSLAGTSLDRHWQAPGAGGLYDTMLAEIRRARRALQRDGHTFRIAGLIWIQGESDAADPCAAARYAENLDRLVSHFRKNVAHDRRLPVLLGIDEQHPKVRKRPIVLQAHKQLADRDPPTIFTSMLGLPKADRSHLTPKGLAAHGERLARAALELSDPPRTAPRR